MYRGLATLVGMTVLPRVKDLKEQVDSLKEHWESFDFLFVHFKYTDSAGEDGTSTKRCGVSRNSTHISPESWN